MVGHAHILAAHPLCPPASSQSDSSHPTTSPKWHRRKKWTLKHGCVYHFRAWDFSITVPFLHSWYEYFPPSPASTQTRVASHGTNQALLNHSHLAQPSQGTMVSCGESWLISAGIKCLSVLLWQKNTKCNDLRRKDEFWQVIRTQAVSQTLLSLWRLSTIWLKSMFWFLWYSYWIIKMTVFAHWSVQDETYGTKQASKAVKGLLHEGICT